MLSASDIGAETDVQQLSTARIDVPIGNRFAVSVMTRGRFDDEVSQAGVPLSRPTLHVGAFDQVWLGAGWDYFDSSKDPKRTVSSWRWPLPFNPAI